MVNNTATLSTLLTANHILHYHSVLDSMGHVSVRNPANNNTFFIALQQGPATVQGLKDIGEYLVADGSPVNGTKGGYTERYIHSEILKAYPDVNSVIHSHSEDVLPYTILDSVRIKSTYHMAGFLGNDVPNFDIESVYAPTDPRDMLVNTPLLGSHLASYFGTNTSQPTSPLHTIVLQRGHGFAVVGSSIEQAVYYAYYTASNARVQTKALLLAGAVGGRVHHLSVQERADCRNMNDWIVFKSWKQWVFEVKKSGMYVNELESPPPAQDQKG